MILKSRPGTTTLAGSNWPSRAQRKDFDAWSIRITGSFLKLKEAWYIELLLLFYCSYCWLSSRFRPKCRIPTVHGHFQRKMRLLRASDWRHLVCSTILWRSRGTTVGSTRPFVSSGGDNALSWKDLCRSLEGAFGHTLDDHTFECLVRAGWNQPTGSWFTATGRPSLEGNSRRFCWRSWSAWISQALVHGMDWSDWGVGTTVGRNPLKNLAILQSYFLSQVRQDFFHQPQFLLRCDFFVTERTPQHSGNMNRSYD